MADERGVVFDDEEPRTHGSLSDRLSFAAAPEIPAFLDELNDPQREAVQTLEGPLLVLACAGTGKTRVLTSRMANIIASGKAWPSQVLAVTFTNKAANEMRHRVGLLTGKGEGMPWLGTFHSVSAKILRRHAELVGLRPDFTILDTDDQTRLLKQILEANNVDVKRTPARLLLALIDNFKNRGWTPDQVPSSYHDDSFGGKLVDYYRAYQRRLKTLNAVDFGDLILEVIGLMKANSDVLAEYHNRFHYIMVDEYQDSNVAQYLWLRLFAQGRNNICCVGDDDQSIYGWRGAEVGNILRFERDFSQSKIIRLEENYRSTSTILATASHLIAHNQKRLKKTLKAKAEQGEKVLLIGAWDADEEARQVVEEIDHLCQEGESPDEVAILVRASSQMRAFEDRMALIGLPYKVIGGPKFYERMEIRDAIAYLRLVNQTRDDLAFERIINVPKRGIGGTSLQRLVAYARRADLSLYAAAREIVDTDELRGQTRAALRQFVENVDRWHGQREGLAPRDLAEMVLEESGYVAMWQADKSIEAPGRLENLKELMRSLSDYETLNEFLEHIALILGVESEADKAQVSLMTLHASKGLEFNTVYLPGWEDGLFPSQRSLDEGGLEEERRLAYVGITRAKRRLRISFAANRQIYGQWQQSKPSRFVDELDAELVEVVGRQRRVEFVRPPKNKIEPAHFVSSSFDDNKASDNLSSRDSAGWQRLMQAREAAAMAHTKVGLGSPVYGARRKGGETFSVGQRVQHEKFGQGDIISLDDNKATVMFGDGDSKRIVTDYLVLAE